MNNHPLFFLETHKVKPVPTRILVEHGVNGPRKELTLEWDSSKQGWIVIGSRSLNHA